MKQAKHYYDLSAKYSFSLHFPPENKLILQYKWLRTKFYSRHHSPFEESDISFVSPNETELDFQENPKEKSKIKQNNFQKRSKEELEKMKKDMEKKYSHNAENGFSFARS